MARMGLALSASLFIAHTVVDSVIERRLFPPYPRHFDTAWKQGVQAILTLFFAGVFGNLARACLSFWTLISSTARLLTGGSRIR